MSMGNQAELFLTLLKREESSMRVQNRMRRPFALLVMALFALVLGVNTSHAQLVKTKGRFVGNALTSGLPIYPNYLTYWNQVSPGNAGKWGSVEGAMGSYDFTWLDNFFNFAINNSIPFKDHCFVWGAQQPNWITGLDSAQQREKVRQWIDTVGARYGSMSMVDVVNEPFHQPPAYAQALGGNGSTGWDWVVTAFAWARQYCLRGVKLLLNEYNILHDNTMTTNYLALVDTLRARGLIDGLGIQGHYFEFRSYVGAPNSYTYSTSAIKSNLDRLVATGLPVYITEFDINEANDNDQLTNYQTYFPIFWENPGVKGITLWGYMQGDMWQTNGYLVRANGTERPALQWLRKYLASPVAPALVAPNGTTGEPRNPRLVWRSTALAKSYRVQVAASGRFTPLVADTTVTDSLCLLAPLSANTQYYWRVTASNDSGTSSYSSAASFTTGDQILAVEDGVQKPSTFALDQNYPNPFNPTTVVSCQLPVVSRVKLEVYDMLGREVATLFDGEMPAGRHEVTFDASGLSSGVYLYRLTAGDYVSSKRMVLMK
jgi:endo-1,4-beta-xylanase